MFETILMGSGSPSVVLGLILNKKFARSDMQFVQMSLVLKGR